VTIKEFLLVFFTAAVMYALLAIVWCSSGHAQDIVIPQRDFQGLNTNANLEMILPDEATEMVNLEVKHGKLVKTFGMGKKLNTTVFPVSPLAVICSTAHGNVPGNQGRTIADTTGFIDNGGINHNLYINIFTSQSGYIDSLGGETAGVMRGIFGFRLSGVNVSQVESAKVFLNLYYASGVPPQRDSLFYIRNSDNIITYKDFKYITKDSGAIFIDTLQADSSGVNNKKFYIKIKADSVKNHSWVWFGIKSQNEGESFGNYYSDSGAVVESLLIYYPASPKPFKNITTYTDDYLGMDASDSGRAYVAAAIDSVGSTLLYVWSGSGWDLLTVAKSHLITDYPATWQYVGQNPIIKDGNALRFLPGKAASIYGHNAKGIWIGRIARQYFDGAYRPDTGYYAYNTPIDKPALAVTWDTISVSGYTAFSPARYYKMSYVYDGVQEGLLSNYTFVPYKDPATSVMTELKCKIDTATFNKRITALNIYKSTDNLSYLKIQEAILNRSNGIRFFSAPKHGLFFAYIPSMRNYPICDTTWTNIPTINGYSSFRIPGNLTRNFIKDKMISLILHAGAAQQGYVVSCTKNADTLHDSTTVYINNGFGPGIDYAEILCDTNPNYCLFSIPRGLPSDFVYKISGLGLHFIHHAAYDSIFYMAPSDSAYLWDRDYHLWYSAPWGGGSTGTTHYGTDFTWEKHSLIIDTTYPQNLLTAGILRYGASVIEPRLIKRNNGRAIEYYGSLIDTSSSQSGYVLPSYNGTYFIEYSPGTGTADIEVYDPGITASPPYPLASEVSIDVNGKYAAAIGNRLWQGNVILDPYGKAEDHPDWLTYSEPGQYDVNPVSNAIKMGDQGGGGITGITEDLGNVLVYKMRNTFKLDISNNDPKQWHIIESFDNLGNIAPYGLTQVGGLSYPVSMDGIYQISPNSAAATHQTPTKQMRITEPIQNYFDSLTVAEKESIIVGYNDLKNELVYKFPFSTPRYFAYSTLYGSWREVEPGEALTILTQDEAGNMIGYCQTDQSVYSTGVKGNSSIKWKSKTFVLDDFSQQGITYIYPTYKTGLNDSLRVIWYSDNQAVPVDTAYLQDTTIVSTIRKSANLHTRGIRGKKLSLQIENATLPDTLPAEIHKIRIQK
jgi:hypothetical protein